MGEAGAKAASASLIEAGPLSSQEGKNPGTRKREQAKKEGAYLFLAHWDGSCPGSEGAQGSIALQCE